jgi:hypothetical protein
VKDLKGAHDEVRLIFDGAGIRWIGELARSDHQAHPLYAAVKDQITGVCGYCAAAFKATAAVQAEALPLLEEFDTAPQPWARTPPRWLWMSPRAVSSSPTALMPR